MEACGIICELNPMHKGHQKLLTYAKSKGYAMVAAMSGPFVQRGSPAIADKWLRAKIAIQAGFDLVVEIPSYFCLQAADFFALGGVSTLSLIPSLKALAFGVEAGYKDKVRTLYDQVEDPKNQAQVKDLVQKGTSWRRAQGQVLGQDLPANTLLALSYLKAMDRLGLSWDLLPLEREGRREEGGLNPKSPSSGAIRQAIERKRMGKVAGQVLVGKQEDIQTLVKEAKQSLNPLTLPIQVMDLTGRMAWKDSPAYEKGMENRLMAQVEKTGKLDQALDLAANKRQSKSRYRRLLVTAILGMKKSSFDRVPYLRVLALNDLGARLLREVQAPVIQKASQADLVGKASQLFCLDQKAQALHRLVNGFSKRREIDQDFYYGPGE